MVSSEAQCQDSDRPLIRKAAEGIRKIPVPDHHSLFLWSGGRTTMAVCLTGQDLRSKITAVVQKQK